MTRFPLHGLAIVYTSCFSRDSGMLNLESLQMNKDSDGYVDMRNFINAPNGKQSANERAKSDPAQSPLVGKTMLQSFHGSIYEDNFDLYGETLEKKCSQDETAQPKDKFQEDGNSVFSKSFYWSMSKGLITGFCGIFCSVLSTCTWRHAYFRFLNSLTDTIYVIAAINLAKRHRLLKQKLEKFA